MLGIDYVLRECVGKFIAISHKHGTDPENATLNNLDVSLLTERDYNDAWQALIQWIDRQRRKKNTFIIPHFALLSFQATSENKDGPLSQRQGHSHHRHTRHHHGGGGVSEGHQSGSSSSEGEWSVRIHEEFVELAQCKVHPSIGVISRQELLTSNAIKCHNTALQPYSNLGVVQLSAAMKHIFVKFAQIIRTLLIPESRAHGTLYDDSTGISYTGTAIPFGNWAKAVYEDDQLNFVVFSDDELSEDDGLHTATPVGLPLPKTLLQTHIAFIQKTPSLQSLRQTVKEDQVPGERSNVLRDQLTALLTLPKVSLDNILLKTATQTSMKKLQMDSLSSRSLSQESAVFPPVFARYALNPLTPFPIEQDLRRALAEVAAHYTPPLSMFTLDSVSRKLVFCSRMAVLSTEKKIRSHQILLDYQLRFHKEHANEETADNVLDLEIARSCQRYDTYLSSQMKCSVPEFGLELTAAILGLLSPQLTYVSRDDIEELLELCLEQVQNNYRRALKQGMLNYILRNELHKRRLKILISPAYSDWCFTDYGALPNGLFTTQIMTEEWENPQDACELGTRLEQIWTEVEQVSEQFINQGMQQTWDLWCSYCAKCDENALSEDELSILEVVNEHSKYDQYCLDYSSVMDIPKGALLYSVPKDSDLPMAIGTFKSIQSDRTHAIKLRLLEDWHRNAVLIWRRFVEEHSLDSDDESTMKLFETVATVMSNQLLSCVHCSIESIVGFFEDSSLKCFNSCDILSDRCVNIMSIASLCKSKHRNINEHISKPVFKLSMELNEEGLIDYDVSISEVECGLGSWLLAQLQSQMCDFSRVEEKIFGLLENVPFISVSIDDDNKSKYIRRLDKSIQPSLSQIYELKRLFNHDYSFLFTNFETELEGWLTVTFEEYDQKNKDNENDNNGNNDNGNDSKIVGYLEEFQKKLDYLFNLEQDFHQNILVYMNKLNLGIFEIDLSNISNMIINQLKELRQLILSFISQHLIKKSNEISNIYENISKIFINKSIENIQQLLLLESTLNDYTMIKQYQLNHEIILINQQFQFIIKNSMNCHYIIGQELFTQISTLSQWKFKVDSNDKQTAQISSVKSRELLTLKFISDGNTFDHSLNQILNEIKAFDNVTINEISPNLSKTNLNLQSLNNLSEKLNQIKEKERLYRNEEELFNHNNNNDNNNDNDNKNDDKSDDHCNKKRRVFKINIVDLDIVISNRNRLWISIQAYQKCMQKWYKSNVWLLSLDDLQSEYSKQCDEISIFPVIYNQCQMSLKSILINSSSMSNSNSINNSPKKRGSILSGNMSNNHSSNGDSNSNSNNNNNNNTTNNGNSSAAASKSSDHLRDYLSNCEKQLKDMKQLNHVTLLCLLLGLKQVSTKDNSKELWEKLSNNIGFDIDPGKNITLEYLIARKAHSQIETIMQVAQEYQVDLEKGLTFSVDE